MKGDSAANPFSPGGNPMSSGEPGMAPVGDGNTPMPAAKPMTTKPRQMPGGAPPSVPGGAPGDMQSPLPGGTGGDTNVPQQSEPSQSKAMAKVREVRRDIITANPDLLPKDAHHLAMQVVAFQYLAKSPQAIPVPAAPGSQTPGGMRTQQPQQGRKDFGGGYFGDLNNPANPYSPMHPNHPMHVDYQRGNGGGTAPSSPHMNPLADAARERGYNGQYPTLVGGVDKALNYGLDKAQQWFKGKPDPDMTPGASAPVQVHPHKQPPAARQRVIPAPAPVVNAPAPVKAPKAVQPPRPKGPKHKAPKYQPRHAASLVYLSEDER